MDKNTLLLIQNLKRKALELCEDRIQIARDQEREPCPPAGRDRRQYGMTSLMKHRHGL